MSSPAFHFRLATLDDAPALLSIYAPYVEKTAISFEYDVPSLDEFRRRIGVFTRSGCKFGRWYNMSWAEKLLMEHPEHPEPVIPFPQLDKALIADILRRAAE